MKLISVVVPCYNAEKYIKDCIDSIRNQSYPYWEIIAIDDGSSDKTLAFLNSYQPILKEKLIIQSVTNSGAGNARNLGLSIAKGELIQFLDSDDVIHSKKFENQIVGFDEEIDCVVSDWVAMDEHLAIINSTKTFHEIIENPLQTAITKVIITGNPLYKTTFVKKIGGYDVSLPSAQDWEFHIRMVLANAQFKYIPGLFFLHREVKNSISSNWIRVSIQACKIINSYEEKLLCNNYLNLKTKIYIAQLFFDSAIFEKNKVQSNEFIDKVLFWSNGNYQFINDKFKKIVISFLGIKILVKILKVKNAFI